MNSLTRKLAKNPVENRRCAAKPFGCGKPVNGLDFRDALSAKEYQISGLCQACQDTVWPDETLILENDEVRST